jgi:DNA mismatch endonuclease, patch repair protein
MNVESLPGRPDFVFWDLEIVVFIHGCFWHGCRKCGGRPSKSRRAFWSEKVRRNKLRDKKVASTLRSSGWRVITFWECKLKSAPLCRDALRRLFSSFGAV